MGKAILMILTLMFLGACTPTQQTEQSQPAVEPSAGQQAATPESAGQPPTEAAKPAAEPKTITTPSGLKYQDLVVGKGPLPKAGSRVMVHYTGRLMDGTKFDSSVDRNQPFSFRLGRGEVIKGWDEGVATMHVGGKRKLTVPPNLGYGAKGFDALIPPNATLVFDLELLGFQ